MKPIFITLASITLMLSLCHAVDTHSIIGNWKTDAVVWDARVGPSVTLCSFNTNGTFTFGTISIAGSASATGEYYLTTNAPTLTNQIVFVANGSTNIHACYFQGSTLVIVEGGRRFFEFKRIEPLRREPLKYEMDGNFDDWKSYETAWNETRSLAERGLDMGRRFVDLKELYYDNDTNYLYLFFKSEPTLEESYEIRPGSGALGYLYIDSDMNTNTGVKRPSTVPGTDIEIYLPIGSGSPPSVHYWMKRWDYALSFNQEVRQESSKSPASLIAHGKHGVELALPLVDLQMSKGRKFALYYSFVPSSHYTRRVTVELK